MSDLDVILTTCGSLDVGSTLLSERDVSKAINMSRTAVRKKYEALHVKGIISLHHGKAKKIIKDVYTGEDHY